MTNTTELNNRIREAREAAGLDVADAARLMAVSAKTLRSWEAGHSTPRPNKLQMLAGVLNVPLLWLIDGGDSYDHAPSRPDRLKRLENKVQRLGEMQVKMRQMSEEIAIEIAEIREIDTELDRLAS